MTIDEYMKNLQDFVKEDRHFSTGAVRDNASKGIDGWRRL